MANSIINSDDGVVSGQSGLKTTGGDTGGLNFQSNGTNVFDYSSTQVVARQTFYAIDDGAPIIARSTDSNAYKYGMEDTSGGTQRGFLGADSSNAFMVANGSATNVLNVTSAGVLQVNSGYGSVANAYMCRAWAKISYSAGTPSISGSAGISGIVDEGTGDITFNLSVTMPDNDYCVVGSAQTGTGGNASIVFSVTNLSLTTTSFRVGLKQGGAFADSNPTMVAVFR